MDSIGIEILKILPAMIGGVIVAWYWNEKRHVMERYCHLDEAYKELLRLYLETPKFGDPKFTAAYGNGKREDVLRYQYFAMTIHTVMETIYDLFDGDVPHEWMPLFRYHTQLHAAWLKNNRIANRPEYVEYVFEQFKKPLPKRRSRFLTIVKRSVFLRRVRRLVPSTM